VTRTKPPNSLYSGEKKTLACEETWLPGCGRKEKEIMRIHKMRLLLIVSIIVLMQAIQPVAADDWNDIYPPYDIHETDKEGTQASVIIEDTNKAYFKIYHPSSGIQWIWACIGEGAISGINHIKVTFEGILDAYIKGTSPWYWNYAEVLIQIRLLDSSGAVYDSMNAYWEVVHYGNELEIYESFTKEEVIAYFYVINLVEEYTPVIWVYASAQGSDSEVTRDEDSASDAFLRVNCISWDEY
jgi:hypothetical protein